MTTDPGIPPSPPSDRYAALTARPVSEVAQRLCADLCGELLAKAGVASNKARRLAFAALAADLIEGNCEGADGWLYRSLRSNSFLGQDVGYDPFKVVIAAVEAQGLIEMHKGKARYARSIADPNKLITVKGEASRFRATERLRKPFGDAGITRDTWADHFARFAPVKVRLAPCVELRSSSGRSYGEKFQGRVLPLPKGDAKLAEIIERVERINSFLALQTFEPIGPVRLTRKFNNGDDPGHGWRHGGRLYGPYSTTKEEDRLRFKINGQAVVELDFQASHLAILAGLGHVPRSILDGDPYEVEGIPRDVVKRWIVMTLGNGRRHRRWPDSPVAALAKKGVDLRKQYPLRATGDAILQRLPVIGDDGSTAKMGWAELQFIESEIVLSAMETLAFDHETPSLPVHDSLIVPVGSEGVARDALSSSFLQLVGVAPVVDLKG